MKKQKNWKQKLYRSMTQMAVASCALAVLAAGTVSAQEQDSYNLPLDAKSAQEIALLDAGVAEEDAGRFTVKQERENREDVFEIEFYYQNLEYEYTIRQEDGMILEWQVGGRDVADAVVEQSLKAEEKEDADEKDAALTTADGTAVIGAERAMQAVTDDLGNADDLTFAKIHFEWEGRFYEYELEVYAGRREYEYTVDAESGEIVRAEMDD